MSDELEQDDELLIEARGLVWRALSNGDETNIVTAIEGLIEAKLAIMLEMMADRIEDAAGVRP